MCKDCPEGRNCLNGRYCLRLKRYVEYSSVPLCRQLLISATEVVRMLTEQKDEPEFVSKRKAYGLFGRANVDRWLRNEEIIPHIRPGKVELRMADLRALQNRVQDYLKNK